MKNKIIKELKDIENKHNINILYAADYGSHSWGWSSPYSDYDIKIVYVRPEKSYFTLNRTFHDTILEDSGENDISGWELGVYLEHLYSRNNKAILILDSPNVYINKDFNSVKNLLSPDAKASVFEYLSIERGLMKKYIKLNYPHEEAELRSLCYIIRNILMAKKIARDKCLPCIVNIDTLVEEEFSGNLSYTSINIRNTIRTILEWKREKDGKKIITVSPVLLEWVKDEMNKLTDWCNTQEFTQKQDKKLFNSFYYDLIKKHSNF